MRDQHVFPLTEAEVFELLDLEEDGLTDRFESIISHSGDPKNIEPMEEILAAALADGDRYSLDPGSWKIEEVLPYDDDPASGALDVSYTASIHLGCRDIGAMDDKSSEVFYSIDRNKLTLTIWIELYDRDTIDEF